MQFSPELFGGYCYLSYFCSVLLKWYTMTLENINKKIRYYD